MQLPALAARHGSAYLSQSLWVKSFNLDFTNRSSPTPGSPANRTCHRARRSESNRMCYAMQMIPQRPQDGSYTDGYLAPYLRTTTATTEGVITVPMAGDANRLPEE